MDPFKIGSQAILARVQRGAKLRLGLNFLPFFYKGYNKPVSPHSSDQLLRLSAPDDVEVYVLNNKQEADDGGFTRRSETESICMFCFATLRSEYPDLLHLEERLHVMSCFSRQRERAAGT